MSTIPAALLQAEPEFPKTLSAIRPEPVLLKDAAAKVAGAAMCSSGVAAPSAVTVPWTSSKLSSQDFLNQAYDESSVVLETINQLGFVSIEHCLASDDAPAKRALREVLDQRKIKAELALRGHISNEEHSSLQEDKLEAANYTKFLNDLELLENNQQSGEKKLGHFIEILEERAKDQNSLKIMMAAYQKENANEPRIYDACVEYYMALFLEYKNLLKEPNHKESLIRTLEEQITAYKNARVTLFPPSYKKPDTINEEVALKIKPLLEKLSSSELFWLLDHCVQNKESHHFFKAVSEYPLFKGFFQEKINRLSESNTNNIGFGDTANTDLIRVEISSHLSRLLQRFYYDA